MLCVSCCVEGMLAGISEISHLDGQSRGCGETWNDYDPTHLRYKLMHYKVEREGSSPNGDLQLMVVHERKQ